MAAYSVGDIVALRFPYSDLKATKIQPGLIIGLAEFENYIICQITSSSYSSKLAIHVGINQAPGMLRESYIRPDKIFTADKSLILRKVSTLATAKVGEVKELLSAVFGL